MLYACEPSLLTVQNGQEGLGEPKQVTESIETKVDEIPGNLDYLERYHELGISQTRSLVVFLTVPDILLHSSLLFISLFHYSICLINFRSFNSPSVCLSFHLFVIYSFIPSIHFIHLSIHRSTRPSVHLIHPFITSIPSHPSIDQPVRPSVRPIHPFIHSSIYFNPSILPFMVYLSF